MHLFSRSDTALLPSLEALVDCCRQLAAGDLAARVDTSSLEGAAAELADTLNAALSQVENRLASQEREVAAMTDVLRELRKGNFEARLIGIDETDPLATLKHAINDFADVSDAFVREAGASLDAVSQNIYYRKVVHSGLQGEYLRTSEHINNATANMGLGRVKTRAMIFAVRHAGIGKSRIRAIRRLPSVRSLELY